MSLRLIPKSWWCNKDDDVEEYVIEIEEKKKELTARERYNSDLMAETTNNLNELVAALRKQKNVK